MKHLIHLLIFSIIFGKSFAGDELPKSNRIIIDFVNENIGKKIDGGVCSQLVSRAVEKINEKYRNGYYKVEKKSLLRRSLFKRSDIFKGMFHFNYGTKISKKDLIPGDIIEYNWKLTFLGRLKYFLLDDEKKAGHICIVYRIDGDSIYVAEQNTHYSIKDSKVEINLLNCNSNKYTKYYNIKYYRPY